MIRVCSFMPMQAPIYVEYEETTNLPFKNLMTFQMSLEAL